MSFAAVAPRLRRFWAVAAFWLAVDRRSRRPSHWRCLLCWWPHIRYPDPHCAERRLRGMMFRANPQHTGVYYTDALPQRGEMAWSLKTGGSISTAPALANGLVYFGSNSRTLYAVDSQTGQGKWKTALPEASSSRQ